MTIGIPGAGDDLAAIRAAFAETVAYTGAGLSAGNVAAVPISRAAGDFLGPGRSVREKAFEIGYADLPALPANGNRITDASGNAWRVIEVVHRDDIEAWHLIVESAA